MQSLEGSVVPVPRAYWSSDDPAILGAPFMFCEKLSGDAVVPWVAATEPPAGRGLPSATWAATSSTRWRRCKPRALA